MIVLNARVHPTDLSQLQHAIAVTQDALKRARSIERKLRGPTMATRETDQVATNDPGEIERAE
jgi:hypothetical protein